MQLCPSLAADLAASMKAERMEAFMYFMQNDCPVTVERHPSGLPTYRELFPEMYELAQATKAKI